MKKELTTLQRVQGLIYGSPKTLLELRIELFKLTKTHVLDTHTAARIRELRKLGHTVVCKPVARDGRSTLFTYEIPKTRKAA